MNNRDYPELFGTEHPVDGKRVSFIRKNANKVLNILPECSDSLEDQRQFLELALCDVRGRIHATEKKSVNECVKNYYWPETKL